MVIDVDSTKSLIISAYSRAEEPAARALRR